MSNLDDFLKTHNTEAIEGYSQQNEKQVETLKKLVSGDNIRSVLEIGFNAGHSSDVFLSANPNVRLISFDLGKYQSVAVGKAFIDSTYPNRHSLVIGDSKISIPLFHEKNPQVKFDLIFIDGGHDYDTAKADFLNCKTLSHPDTLVIMDDTTYSPGYQTEWSVAPTDVWTDAVETGFLLELGKEEYKPGRGMSWGKYDMTFFSKPAIPPVLPNSVPRSRGSIKMTL